ncbi:MAG TPA: hypothetical protein VLX09_25990 [Stellaceae bacterium]|nr:hypothetical protein [Stellaceae bacterium]
MAEDKDSRRAELKKAVPSKEELQKLRAKSLMEKADQATQQQSAEQDRKKSLIAHLETQRVTEQNVKNAIRIIRELAAAGETEVMVLRFPNELCTDGGRAINNSEADWPRTLTGFPKDIYEKWQVGFRDQGFRLTAKILEFPGGMPGDVGMFMNWD